MKRSGNNSRGMVRDGAGPGEESPAASSRLAVIIAIETRRRAPCLLLSRGKKVTLLIDRRNPYSRAHTHTHTRARVRTACEIRSVGIFLFSRLLSRAESST